jgi:ATP-dependent DNA helicase Q4
MVDFHTLGYHFRSPGDMTDEELDEAVDFLMNRIESQEKTELYHLENFHETLER